MRRKPLDVDQRAAARRLRCTCWPPTSSQRGVAASSGTSRTPAALFGALRAGATMPVIAGGPYAYEQRLLLDASLERADSRSSRQNATGTRTSLVLLTRGAAHAAPRVGLRSLLRVASAPADLAAARRAILDARGAVQRDRPHHRRRARARSAARRVLGIRVDDVHISKLEMRREILLEGCAPRLRSRPGRARHRPGRAIDEACTPATDHHRRPAALFGRLLLVIFAVSGLLTLLVHRFMPRTVRPVS